MPGILLERIVVRGASLFFAVDVFGGNKKNRRFGLRDNPGESGGRAARNLRTSWLRQMYRELLCPYTWSSRSSRTVRDGLSVRIRERGGRTRCKSPDCQVWPRVLRRPLEWLVIAGCHVCRGRMNASPGERGWKPWSPILLEPDTLHRNRHGPLPLLACARGDWLFPATVRNSFSSAHITERVLPAR